MNDKYFKKIKFADGRVYLLNTPLFFFVMICIAFIGVGMFIDSTHREFNYYTVCNDKVKCFNEYFNSSECGSKLPIDRPVCTQEWFMSGQSDGSRPSFLMVHGPEMALALLCVAFLFNHLKFNKGFKLSEDSE